MSTSSLRAPTVDTDVNFWPGIIDMLTSLLMFFMLIYFVQHNVNPASLASEVARQKQQKFNEIFEREFADDIARGEIRLEPDGNLLQITFGDEILFGRGKFALRSRGAAILRRLAIVIAQLDRASSAPLYDQIQIEGHTDSASMSGNGYPRDNWELSVARALEVLRYLTERSSPRLNARKLSANGYADTRPVHTSASRNRRIEIRIYFSGKGEQ